MGFCPVANGPARRRCHDCGFWPVVDQANTPHHRSRKHGREPQGHENLEKISLLFASDAKGNSSGASSSVPGSKEEEKPIDLLAVLFLGEQAFLQNKHLQVGGKLLICFNWLPRTLLKMLLVLVVCVLLYSPVSGKGRAVGGCWAVEQMESYQACNSKLLPSGRS